MAALGTPASAHEGHGPAAATGQQTRPAETAPEPSLAEGVERSRQRAFYFAATMSGDQEVPTEGGPAVGDPDGRATTVVRVQGNRVSFVASWRNQQAATLFHLHEGRRGQNGDVRVTLLSAALPETVTSVAGVARIDDARITEPTLGHIHRGQRGANGDVVVPLFTTEIPDGVVAVSGSVPVKDAGLLREIKDRPRDFYLNLHTEEQPGGAVRGQLFARR
ncbi:CHRD domain-containing protein [Paractinoplanes brasiliensis]|uniref:CHRD domain-containing protein n=1 Tax=Paractinoplanes brasiliensis TaxID=52695 RepID=A0A4R6JL84_9ACTN|nr:CHRD domain-containing protein [Actinoplanes brasiliensis]TDO37054.1 CHRD domain-containing protein [Actinoplanes brasiliensis]